MFYTLFIVFYTVEIVYICVYMCVHVHIASAVNCNLL